MIYLIIFIVFIFGLTIGSFLNCLIWRLHTRESLLNRSYCPKCKKQIAWYDNIPVVSYLILGGKCRNCKKPISIQYPIIELITAFLFLMAFIVNFSALGGSALGGQFFSLGPDPAGAMAISPAEAGPRQGGGNFISLLRDWFIISVMIIVFIYDLRWYLILDIITLPACAIVLILNLLLGISWQDLLFSGIIGSSFFLIQFIISRGKWIGGGDIRLGLLIGLTVGWPAVLLAIFLAYIMGSISGVFLVLFGKKSWGSQIPLGIFLSTATIISLLWGEIILNKYLSIFYY